MARRDSVTVSMAALTIGRFKAMLRVSLVWVSTSVGKTDDFAGRSRTSSKVSPSGIGPSSIGPSSHFLTERLKIHSNGHQRRWSSEVRLGYWFSLLISIKFGILGIYCHN